MLLLVWRKMLSNKWMVICLLIGFILAVAMVSSIPMYTNGILQRMLTKDLEEYQLSSGNYPGRYHIKAQYSKKSFKNQFYKYDDQITGEMIDEFKLPYISKTRHLSIDYIYVLPEIQRQEKPKKQFIKLEALTGIDDHCEIKHGRLPSKEKDGNIYEVMVTEEAMQKKDLILDEVYNVQSIIKDEPLPLKLKVVGVFSPKDKGDGYWFQGEYAYGESLIMNEELYFSEVLDNEMLPINTSQWYYAIDYHKMVIDNLDNILNAYKRQERMFAENRNVDINMPSIPIIERYSERESQLKTSLWVLNVPILLMLAFYLYMISNLIIEGESDEIAIMQSRGASPVQIFYSYLVESAIIGIVSLAVGPPLGLAMCKIIGSANGFLEFIGRVALPVALDIKVYIYSLWAMVLSMLTMLIPAYGWSRVGIVERKQEKTKRKTRKSMWKRYFIDFVLLALAAYGTYNFTLRQKTLEITGAEASELTIDPLLFLVSTLFILGTGLLFLRLYPYIVRLIAWIGKDFWPTSIYTSFIQVGRSGGQNEFIMLFLIMALSIGLFSANAARTVNRSIEERIKYSVGADISIKPTWESDEVSDIGDPMGGGDDEGFASLSTSREPVKYKEPPYDLYADLSGAESVTKVFSRDDGTVRVLGESAAKVQIMGIIPNEFGKIAWFRDDLLKPYHINQYLNLLSESPKAFLVSSSFKEKFEVEEGDPITIGWKDQGNLDGYIYGFVDYFPYFNPNALQEGRDDPLLVVANLSYIHAKTALEPYEIWVKKAPNVTSQEIYDDILEKHLDIASIEDTSQEIIKKKNDPMLQGMNGGLTLGFIISMLISFMGFLIFWILSIHSRELQFGIFRAMGLPGWQLISMLFWEQVLTSGVAIFMGITIGGISSKLYVPFLQIIYSSAEQVPPFKVVAYASDYTKVYIVVLIMLIGSFGILASFIKSMKIHQALKLG
ncbi:MAG: ABC transporter permease, partial [Clostridiales bacterium]|nr:ABC transporter permease [Clostridiales bacterium]